MIRRRIILLGFSFLVVSDSYIILGFLRFATIKIPFFLTVRIFIWFAGFLLKLPLKITTVSQMD